MSVHERLAVAFSLVSGTVMPVMRARVNARVDERLCEAACPRCTGSLKCIWFVFSVRQREPDVVGLGDRAAEPALVEVADVEVLVEPPAPDLRRRAPFPCRLSHPSLRFVGAVCRARTTTGRSIISPPGRWPPSLRRRPRRRRRRPRAHAGAALRRREYPVHHGTWAGWMHALPRMPDRAGEQGVRFEALVVAHVEVHDVEGRADRRARSPGRARIGQRGARGRPPGARGGTRGRDRRPRAAAPPRAARTATSCVGRGRRAVSTIAISGRPARPRASALRASAFGNTIASRPSSARVAASSSQKRRGRAVDADHGAGTVSRSESSRATISRGMGFCAGTTASSRSRDYRVRVRVERLAQLAARRCLARRGSSGRSRAGRAFAVVEQGHLSQT